MPIGEQLADLLRSDLTASAVKATPPVSAVVATFLGVPLADWVLAVTLVYTSLQIYVLIRDKLVQRHKKE
ncbi:MAG: hypothetical protein WCA85_26130 [Paraburkholderia sp.]|uniref:hypothetical protein n=1 Tax=Paraburkholderia sp. TaxID=1926495 RepID=UPI003C68808F